MSKRHYKEFSSRHDYFDSKEHQEQVMESLDYKEVEVSRYANLEYIDQIDPIELMEHATRVAWSFANSLYDNGYINRRYQSYDIEDIAMDTIADVYANAKTLNNSNLELILHPFIIKATKRTINALQNVRARHTVIISDDHIQWLETNSIASVLVANDVEYTQRDYMLVEAYANTLNNAQQRTRNTLEDIAANYATSQALTNQNRQALKRFKVNALKEYKRLKEEQEKRDQIKDLTKQLRRAKEDKQGPILKQLEALYNALDQ